MGERESMRDEREIGRDRERERETNRMSQREMVSLCMQRRRGERHEQK
jgi:hypothetical protein